MRFATYFVIILLFQAPPRLTKPTQETEPLSKSAYFAFVDRDLIFTLEVIKEGVPILNFVSMTDEQHVLYAKLIRLRMENRNIPSQFLMIDTSNPREPILVPSIKIKPRSSFGSRLKGKFADMGELEGVTIGLEREDLTLDPLSSFEFESLATKVNRINLDSPNFRDDWRVLKLERMGSRKIIRRRRLRP